MNGVVQDLRFALRQIWRKPGFTLIAVVSLALGIGANTSIFTLIDKLILKSLPARQPEQLAMGAQSGSILGMVLRKSLLLLAIGIIVGVPATLASTRLIQSQLFGLSPFDGSTIAMALMAIAAVIVLSAYFPARRAAKIDPMVALRYE